MYYVYILNLKEESFYVGCTRDLKARMGRHSKGETKSIKDKIGNYKLHCYFAFPDKETAFRFEKYLKSGSGRAFTKKHFQKIMRPKVEQ